MGGYLNFNNFGNEPPGDVGGGSGGGGMNRPPGNVPLNRQGSIYSLTFDEFQSSLGKDFGSMNMDELLKNIWSAEETQAMASTSGVEAGAVRGQEGLQRQGSLTLPRTLSQKTVDEVWKDISKDYTTATASKDINNGTGGSGMPQRQQTLGEITLEEFLVRAGVVREETQVGGKVNNGGYFGDTSHSGGNNSGSVLGFQQASRVSGLMGNLGPESGNQMSVQNSILPLNVNGVRSSTQQQPIVPKQPGFGYGTQMTLPGGQINNSHGIRGGLMGIADQCLGGNAGLVQSSGLMVGGGLGLAGAMGVGGVSPVTPLSSDGIGKSNNGDTSSVSPSPYMFSGGVRGRKRSGAVEKVVERRQRRMIKNRESAARSRARKQAYTMELEAEVAKLKEENQELRRKQAEMVEMQKNQANEVKNVKGGPMKRLRRTQTGPW
ncbi:PREDICTED: ABSCISIC ACID-INSENSITIVE 5-like protein 5 [Tarenaya hassleriana]|uniref:ABSCISIC ACID-INSENSITIVE 5-like protein 5 n=1 Tax=Tarenaya hassleriana TaxID=28532 RepID=UPI00053C1AE9|nr:PREDICTED: ABSCISIC ACID-INSENSITIVE 5-like protein 5 [Tarenaya hassleriana]XP_010538117.1 PREDICTED: ABSCISIC ACID-INSENSITIVE 5-like protein 5 [Tarenaya hassleriana]